MDQGETLAAKGVDELDRIVVRRKVDTNLEFGMPAFFDLPTLGGDQHFMLGLLGRIAARKRKIRVLPFLRRRMPMLR